MGNIQHANAKTTPRIRKEIQDSNESLAKLAKKYSLNVKTVAKWKNRSSTKEKRTGPKVAKSTVLSELEEKIICEFRRVTKHSLDDVYISLKDEIPKLTRSNLHRCLKRNNLNVLPKDENKKKEKKEFKQYDIGYVHIDISELYTKEGKAYMFVAIDRATKYVYVEIYERMTIDNACLFLRNLIKDCCFKITKILTDNGVQFTYKLLAKHLQPKNKIHPFDEVCNEYNIEHRLTRFRHPWTNGQVEIMNKIIKSHTTKKYYYETLKELKQHILSFLMFYNFQKKLKSLKYKSPYDMILQIYNQDVSFFNENPTHKKVGLNNYFT